MATGIVVGLSRHRDRWSPVPNSSDHMGHSTRAAGFAFTAMDSAGHHRSFSDVPDVSDRPRLPPLKNFLEGAGRPDLSYRPSVQRAQDKPQFSSRPAPGPSPTSPETSSWPLKTDPRPSYQQHGPYQSGPTSENFFPTNDYGRRANAAMPLLSGTDGRHNPSHLLSAQSPDPISADARTTSKSVVREEVIPSKGLCYVYDDGTVCQKVINGDPVNPKWGTTKAGKPRKRLGQACNTCREKKIKCDPNYPKCTQCQKFGRECKFEAPSRVHKSPRMRLQTSPTAFTAIDETARARRPSVALTETSSHSESGTSSSKPTAATDEHLSPVNNESNHVLDTPIPYKKARLTHAEAEVSFANRTGVSSLDPYQAFSLDTDPFKVNKKMVEAYLNAYLTYVNNSALSLVPGSDFWKWVEDEDDKTPVSRLVLYCMLAVGCVFAKNSERTVHEQHFASVALEGVLQSFGHFSLQLIQARLIFALYEFHNGHEDRAWDLCGAAMRAAGAMKINTEEGISQRVRETVSVYGLDRTRLAECMRRTFWTAFVMERFGAACMGFTTTINVKDCHLRLPCTRQAYESGSIPQTPYLDSEAQSPRHGRDGRQGSVSTLAYMVQIASLCCEVHTFATRAGHSSSPTRAKSFIDKRNELERQLCVWEASYATHVASAPSGDARARSNRGFSFGGLHIMYHYACMQLHRHVRFSHLSHSQISDHVKKACHHAEKTLEIAEQLMSRNFQDTHHYNLAAMSPLSGYAILSAIDILTAVGINVKLLENQSAVMTLIMGSVQLLDSLTEHWSSARTQQRLVRDRIQLMMNSAQTGMAEGKAGFYVIEPIAMSLGHEVDLVYGIDRLHFFEALGFGDQVRGRSDLMEATSKVRRATYTVWKD